MGRLLQENEREATEVSEEDGVTPLEEPAAEVVEVSEQSEAATEVPKEVIL